MQPRRRALALVASMAVTAVLVATPGSARAEAGNFGLGLIVGSPTGLSMKMYLNRTNAIDAALGGAILGAKGVHAHADYLWHPWVLASEGSFELAAYTGLGVRLLDHDRDNHDDDLHLGIRGPIGIVFDFARANVPLDVFAELGLILDFAMEHDDANEDEIDLELNAGIGVRYYF